VIGKAIYAQLSGNAGVQALVGAPTDPDGPRIWPEAKPGLTNYPALVYTSSVIEAPSTYTGRSNLTKFQVNVMCIARTKKEAEALAAAALSPLDSTRGTWGGVVVQLCWYEDRQEERITIGDDQENVFESITLTFNAWAQL
jgi:hypothetical protein